MTPVIFVRASPSAKLPRRGTAHSAGFDLYADQTAPILLQGGAGYVAVETNIRVRIPQGYYGRIAPRSGLSAKQHVSVGAGVIDRDYTGTIKVLLCCIRAGAWESIDPANAIAQLIIEQCGEMPGVERDELPPADMEQHAGWGSTDRPAAAATPFDDIEEINLPAIADLSIDDPIENAPDDVFLE